MLFPGRGVRGRRVGQCVERAGDRIRVRPQSSQAAGNGLGGTDDEERALEIDFNRLAGRCDALQHLVEMASQLGSGGWHDVRVSAK